MKKFSLIIAITIKVLFLIAITFPFSAVAQEQEKGRIAVGSLKTNIVDKDLVALLNDHIKDYIKRSALYEVFARKDIKTEGIERFLSGSIVKIGKKFTINLRLVDVETNEIIDSLKRRSGGDELISSIGLALSGLLDIPIEKEGEALQVPVARYLYVESDPSGVAVYVNGIKQGETPLKLENPQLGSYKIEIIEKGFYTWEETVEVKEGSVHQILASLKGLHGTLSINSSPQGAEVFIDKKFLGKTPIEVAELNAGVYELSIREKGYWSFNEFFEIKSGGMTDIFQFLLETDSHEEYREVKSKSRKWIFGTLVAGGLMGIKAHLDSSDASKIYADANDAYNNYKNAINPQDIKDYKALTISLKGEGDSKNNSANMFGSLSLLFLGASGYYYVTTSSEPDRGKSGEFKPLFYDESLLFSWKKRF